MRQFTREEILTSLKKKVAKNECIVACGAGAGLIAKAAQTAGVDLILASAENTARADGASAWAAALPYVDANQVTLALSNKLLPIMNETPVIAGVGANDPYRDIDGIIDEISKLGYSGVVNSPTVGFYDADLRAQMSHAGYQYENEEKMIKSCKSKDIFTLAYACNAHDAERMAVAGADVIVARYIHKPGTAFKKALQQLHVMVSQIKANQSDSIVLIEICPFSSKEQVQEAISTVGAQGIVGASAIESVPAYESLQCVFSEILSIQLG